MQGHGRVPARFRKALCGILTACVWMCSAPALGASTSVPVTREAQNRAYFTDLEVLTHQGRAQRFYSDVLEGHLVAISFFYVNCPSAQPALVSFFKLQRMLGDKLGRSVRLVTISVDPENDSLAAVQEFARKYAPREGWLFLTGAKTNLDEINRRLGNTGPLPEGHLRLVLLGNPQTGHWVKLTEDAHEFALAKGLQRLAETQ